MADKKPPGDPKDSKRQPNEPEQRRPKHKPEGREHQVHKEILDRRWRGGPPPTSDASRRALEEWKNLPGSIVRPPTDVTIPPDKQSEQEQGDTGDRTDEEDKH
jgi:hypothetical protein